MRVTLAALGVVGILVGLYSDISIMGLAAFGFWSGLAGVLLCGLAIAVAMWLQLFSFFRQERGVPWAAASSVFSGFVFGASVALGFSLGEYVLGSVLLGVLFAVVVSCAVSWANFVFTRRAAEDIAESRWMREYYSRPIVMDVDESGRMGIYRRPY